MAPRAIAPHAPAPARGPTLEELIGRCRADYPRPDRCWAAHDLASAPALDVTSRERAADACARGDAPSCAWLGWIHEVSARDNDEREEALSSFQQALTRSSFDLGACGAWASRTCEGIRSGSSCCDRGIVGCPDGCEAACDHARTTARAATLGVLDPACDAGDRVACLVAGVMYEEGAAVSGVGTILAPDGAAAKARLTRACALDVGVACFELGMDLEESDVSRADALERRACRLGAAGACRAVARRLSEHGSRLARAFDERACRLGMPLVCADLGLSRSTSRCRRRREARREGRGRLFRAHRRRGALDDGTPSPARGSVC